MRGADASGDLLAVTPTTFPPLLVSSACWLQAGARNGAMRGLLGSCTFLLHREQCSCSGCRRWALCIAPALYFRDEPLLTAHQSHPLCSLYSPCSWHRLAFTPAFHGGTLPQQASIELFWKSCKDSQDLHGALASAGRFSECSFPFIKSLSRSLKEMPPTLLNMRAC